MTAARGMRSLVPMFLTIRERWTLAVNSRACVIVVAVSVRAQSCHRALHWYCTAA
jgi:hypothetical protein